MSFDAPPPPPPGYGAPSTPGMPFATQAAPKEYVTAVMLAYFLGWLGVDRFYLGYTGLGIAKLAVSIFTCFIGGVIWQLIDTILIVTGNMPDAQGRPLVFRTRNVSISA